MTERSEALKRVDRANKQILLGMGALLLASLNASKAVKHLQKVVYRETVVSKAPATYEDTKEALEDMVETYSSGVN